MAEFLEDDPRILRAVFDNMNAGMILTDHSGQITGVNPQAERLVGRRARSMTGQDFHDLLHRRPDGSLAPRDECPLMAVAERGEVVRVDTDSFLHADGSLLPVSWSGAPVTSEGRTLGVVTMVADATEAQATRDHLGSQLAAMEDLTARLTLVGEITEVLTQTLEAEEALNRLGRLLIHRLADWAAVDLRIGDDEVRRVAVVGPQGRDAGQEGGQGTLSAIPEASRSVLARVLRGGEAVLLGPEEIAAPPDSPLAVVHTTFLHALGAVSAVVVPLSTPRQVMGALTVARTDPGRPFREDELPLFKDIGRRAGLAIDNARLFERQRDIAATMQRHLLPSLPDIHPLEVTTRYRPAPRGSQVGGDWYDAIVLPGHRIALAIGDVVGHDLSAAAGMAQLRNMLRIMAWDRAEPPGVIVDRLDEAMSSITDVLMATLILARIERAGPGEGPGGGGSGGEEPAEGERWTMRWASAGHPPPLLVTPEGGARYLEQGQALLLGARMGDTGPRRDGVAELPPGSTLLLYTDGLVELTGSDLDTGLNRLRRHATALASHGLDDFCDQILDRMPPGGADDIAMVALRVPGADAAA
ncbi:SpoIIE family protein phosphatase [Streptomyces sp. DSM 44917]|uniref:SpoIIE family protein phosphatase n=1 Tax=Streptomyces boetiae TaxID=3075541 RepID=A0ABU2L433_9ACTN|nr:SpoIIE family protein phosphatase [Streptomyces sp. DSM 44917]MDT0306318.1 SpoIIE family protein phosphatase [Streptomyces sp. DSM 44917]